MESPKLHGGCCPIRAIGISFVCVILWVSARPEGQPAQQAHNLYLNRLEWNGIGPIQIHS